MRIQRIALLAAGLALLVAGLLTLDAPGVPRCPEDALLVGAGQFHAGRWSRYECGPAADDCEPQP